MSLTHTDRREAILPEWTYSGRTGPEKSLPLSRSSQVVPCPGLAISLWRVGGSLKISYGGWYIEKMQPTDGYKKE
jgi:hypothetical protein